jgi:ribosome-associated protein
MAKAGMATLPVTDTISLDESELSETFVRASGPGGQNVNKLSTAVQLRFDVRRSPSLPNDVAIRLQRLAGKRLTQDGVLVIVAQQHRTQERNRQDARDRLFAMIREAAIKPAVRRATKPTKASKTRRLEGKKRRGDVKALRRSRPGHD